MSTIREDLPNPAESGSDLSAAIEANSGNRVARNRLLMVDDEPTVLRALDRVLGARYEICCAESGHQALEQVESGESFAVILTDMRMPEMDGLEFIESALRVSPQTVCILLTGNSEIEPHWLENPKIYKVLTKPTATKELRSVVTEAFKEFESRIGN